MNDAVNRAEWHKKSYSFGENVLGCTKYKKHLCVTKYPFIICNMVPGSIKDDKKNNRLKMLQSLKEVRPHHLDALMLNCFYGKQLPFLYPNYVKQFNVFY